MKNRKDCKLAKKGYPLFFKMNFNKKANEGSTERKIKEFLK